MTRPSNRSSRSQTGPIRTREDRRRGHHAVLLDIGSLNTALATVLTELYSQGFEIMGHPDRLRLVLSTFTGPRQTAEVLTSTGIPVDRFRVALSELVRRGVLAEHDGALYLDRSFSSWFGPAVRAIITMP